MRTPLLMAALSVAALPLAASGPARATLLTTATLASPGATSGSMVVVNLAGIATPSSSTLSGAGYTLTFNTAAGQGIVNGNMGGAYALPVAGASNGTPTYLTGNYGSAQTTNANAAGNYLSTGTGSISIAFSTPETSLTLLWGSVDTYNSINFLAANGTVLDTLTGSAVQSLAQNFAGNGFQGANGSAYVTATESTPFKTVQFVSTAPSFEFAGVAATTGTFGIPEPLSLALLGSGLAATGLARALRRRA